MSINSKSEMKRIATISPQTAADELMRLRRALEIAITALEHDTGRTINPDNAMTLYHRDSLVRADATKEIRRLMTSTAAGPYEGYQCNCGELFTEPEARTIHMASCPACASRRGRSMSDGDFEGMRYQPIAERIRILESILTDEGIFDHYDKWLASKVRPLAVVYDRRGNIRHNLEGELWLLKRRVAEQVPDDAK